jgi:hypothetical protein
MQQQIAHTAFLLRPAILAKGQITNLEPVFNGAMRDFTVVRCCPCPVVPNCQQLYEVGAESLKGQWREMVFSPIASYLHCK